MNKDEINTGGPAFPGTQYAGGISPTGHATGMDLRDYFAAKAMQGFLAGDAMLNESDTSKEWLNNIADAAYEMADAMLKARGNK